MKITQWLVFVALELVVVTALAFDPNITPTKTWTCTHATERTDGTPFDFGAEGQWIHFDVAGDVVQEPDCLFLMDFAGMPDGDYVMSVRTEDTEGRVGPAVEVPFSLKVIALPNPPSGVK